MRHSIWLSVILILTLNNCFATRSTGQISSIRSESTKVEKNLDSLSVNLTSQLMQHAPNRKDKPLLAILPPVNANGKISELGQAVAGSLQQKLFLPERWRMLERERIDSMLSETELSQSGMLKDNEATGKMLGAQLLVVGSLRDLGNRYQIEIRLVDFETGVVEATASAQLYATGAMAIQYKSEK